MISDHDMIRAWTQVLTLSKLQPGQGVTVLTTASTHPQTLQTAIIAASAMGAIVNRLDLPPVNGELAHSRDPLAYLGTTPLTGNRAAIAALKESDLVLDLPIGSRLSLFPMGTVEGESEGLRWPLKGLHFAPDGMIGTSNEVAAPEVTLQFSAARMLVILPRSALVAALDGFGLSGVHGR